MEVLVSRFPHCSKRRRVAAAGCAAVLLAAQAVRAQDGAQADGPRHPLSVVAGADVSHDSNLFRQPESANPSGDTITVLYGGVRLDKEVSLQRFQAGVTQTIRRHARNSNLDFTGLDYDAAWQWQLASRVRGTLSADRKESLVPFEDVFNPGNTSRNVRVNENRNFSLDARAIGNWYVVMGLSRSAQRSELAVPIQPDYDATSREAGIRYDAPTGSSAAVIRRVTNGDYLNQSSSAVLGTGYGQHETEFRVRWVASALSTLSARLIRLDREQSGASQRDFSGLNSELVFAWQPTGKLSMNLVASREIAPFQDISGSHVISETFSLAPRLEISPRTTARMLFVRTASDFAGAAAGPARRDRLTLAEAGVDWSPAASLSVGASVTLQERDSTVPAFAFRNTITRLTVSYRF